jgi:hypothetical protein
MPARNLRPIKSLKKLMDILEEQEPSGGVEESKDSYKQEQEIPTILQPLVSKKPVSKHTLCNICTYVNDPGSTECIICNSELTEEEIKAVLSYKINYEYTCKYPEIPPIPGLY